MSEHQRYMGYPCTSPTGKNPGVQVDMLKQAACNELYVANNCIDPREARKELLDLLGNGDMLLVYRLDRFCRDEHSLANLQQQLQAIGVMLVTTENSETKKDNYAQ